MKNSHSAKLVELAIRLGSCISISALSLFVIADSYASSHINVSCRDAVRPLLLQQTPDRSLLPAIQQLCEAQAEQGEPQAQYQLALLHLGVADWDPGRAIPLIQTAADAGIAEAQYWLAWQYEEGPLLTNDIALALRWYRQAGENEHKIALDRLATAYERGDLGLQVSSRQASLFRARAARCQQSE